MIKVGNKLARARQYPWGVVVGKKLLNCRNLNLVLKLILILFFKLIMNNIVILSN